jgi:hypothetical protein
MTADEYNKDTARKAALGSFCGYISCIWTPADQVCPHFNGQPAQVEGSSGDGQATLEKLDILSPTPSDTPISPSSVTHVASPFDTSLSVAGDPKTETEHTASPPPSPLTLHPQSPIFSDMSYEESEPGNALPQGPQGLQVNPFVGDQFRHEAYERLSRIFANEEEDEAIKKKNKDVLKFLNERPLRPSERGKGSRGGVESYSCAFPGCGEKIPRRDRAIDHVLIHFGARPFRCTFWYALS